MITKRHAFALAASGAVLAGTAGYVLAQDQDEQEKSRFIRFVEEQLSTPNRQIRLNGIQGTLSSNVRFESITIADENGVWLTIENPSLQWQRSALILGKLDISNLSADRIDWPRNPIPDENLPAPESSGFSLPELPVSVDIGELAIGEAQFGEPVFGLASTLSLEGQISLGDGTLNTDLDITRLDGPGGQLALQAAYSNATTQLDLDLSLQEPADGVVANLIDIPERPPVSLTLAGGGQLDDLDLGLAFDVDSRRIATGSFRLSDTLLTDDRRAELRLSGPLSSILPQQHRAFFGAETSIESDMILRNGGGLDLQRFEFGGGALSISASGSTLADWFPRELIASISMRSNDGSPVRLPVSGEAVTVGSGSVSLRFGQRDAQEWSLDGQLLGFDAPDYAIGEIRLDGSGAIQNIADAANRFLSFDIDAQARSVEPADPDIAAATGYSLSLAITGDWRSENPIRLESVTLSGDTLDIAANGQLESLKFNGNARIEAADLAAFSPLADRELRGAASLSARGEAALVGGAFDLSLDGTLVDAVVGDALADRLIRGTTRLTGGVARAPDGLRFNSLLLENPQSRTQVNGAFATTRADLRAHAEIFDVATLDDRASGRLALDATIDKAPESQRDDPYDVSASLSLSGAQLLDRRVPSAEFAFDGAIKGAELAGNLSGTGLIGGEPIDVSGAISRSGDRIDISGLSARIGASTFDGDIVVENGLSTGSVAARSNDISSVAALALVDASGAVNGDIRLSAADGRQDATVDLTARDFRFETNTVGNADIDIAARDLFGVPQVDATVNASDIDAGGVAVASAQVTAKNEGDMTRFTADARLDDGARAVTAGTLRATSDGFDARLETLSADTNYGDLRLRSPATIARAGGVTRIDNFDADVAGGRITASGTVADRISIRSTVSSLPLSIANGFRPDLGLGGVVNGSIDVSGTPGDPSVSFSMQGAGLNAAALRSASVSPINASVSGTYSSSTVRIDSFSARNAQDLDFSGSGTVPLSGPGLSVRLTGGAPLALAERYLAERGTRVSGTLRIDATVGGSLSSPAADGLFSISNGSVADPLSNLRLNQIGGVAGLRGDTLSINRLTGQLAGGGSVSLSGTVGLTGVLPADLAIRLSNAVYSDGETIRTTLSGDLAVSGGLTAGPLLSGRINLLGTEITIPETLSSDANLLDVDHVNVEAGTLRTLRRLQAVLPRDDNNAPQAPVRLDITVNSPNRIFVRGRGIDAELGGQVRVTGPLNDVRPVGAFNLIRGRLSVLNKRLELTEGRITLSGSLDPMINLTAQVNGDDIVAYVRLTGRASDLSLDLSASPELPEDEILARVLFGKGIASLSPIQIANLATAAASLASGGGGGGGGLSEQIRQGLGVDDLDITQDKEGNVAVKAGKYIQDNVYLDVQAGQSGGEVSINLDVTDSLTAKGSVDTDGDSKLGIFFEKDY